MLNDFIIPGKLNMILDGQFGSTGKGAIAARIWLDNHIDIACARLSSNAGHTFYYQDKKYVTKMLPVTGIMDKRNLIYLCAGCVIDVPLLQKEINEFDIDPSRIIIHPRAAVITDQDREEEQKKDGIITIASTQSGTGAARASKIMRSNPLVQGTPELQKYINSNFDLQMHLDSGLSVLVETGQGFDLSLNCGFVYPYCTSIDCIPSAILTDCGLHPEYLGNIMMTLRTYPIRVGNPKDEDGNELGDSGPVYPDSKEIKWEDLDIAPELTTVTKRIRRVFTFSEIQYLRALKVIKPTHVFLNFINYLTEDDLEYFKSLSPPTHVGYGPHLEGIRPFDPSIFENEFYERN